MLRLSQLFLSSILCVFVSVGHSEDLKIGFVNTERVFKESAPAVRSQKKLQQEFSVREEEIKSVDAEAKGIRQRLEKDGLILEETQRRNLEGELGSFSRLLSAVSTEADILAYSGCPQVFGEVIDKSPFFNHGVQYPFQFDELHLERIMHKKSYSVFGRIDFFSVLRQLLVSLGGSLEEQWTISAPELLKVFTVSARVSPRQYHPVLLLVVLLGHTVRQT